MNLRYVQHSDLKQIEFLFLSFVMRSFQFEIDRLTRHICIGASKIEETDL